MMGWYNGGMGGSGSFMWIFMGVFWIALIVAIVFLVIKLLPSGGAASVSSKALGNANESPEQILDRMFAVGEIDEQTYRARRTALSEMRGPS